MVLDAPPLMANVDTPAARSLSLHRVSLFMNALDDDGLAGELRRTTCPAVAELQTNPLARLRGSTPALDALAR
ncbi:hypothetical protein [Promicromonospora sp. NPDC023805]|uniref:hypothetical protein n=1 Tax=Promicromonospora sp. NPDC023805 TaxID=3154696 RepID=UPI0033E0AA87